MITIKASATGKVFNYNSYFSEYFAGGGAGNPDPFESNHMGMNYDGGKIIQMYGQDFAYDFRSHIVSGSLNTMQFTAGGATQLSITGLSIANPAGQAGELHDLVASLMAGGPPGSGGSVDPATLQADLAAEAQHYIGMSGKDIYTGTAFDDRIEGELGSDSLNGGLGGDTFVFDTKLGNTNVDKIKGFSTGQGDEIELGKKIFKGLGSGALDDDHFTLGKQAEGSGAQILYNKKSGALYYDADGAGGHDPVLFAKLAGKPSIDHDDFLIG